MPRLELYLNKTLYAKLETTRKKLEAKNIQEVIRQIVKANYQKA